MSSRPLSPEPRRIDLRGKDRLIVALDVATSDEALRTVDELDNVSFFKVGWQLFMAGDLVMLLSNSGATPELRPIMHHARHLGCPIIGITCELEAARWGEWVREAAVSPVAYTRAVERAGGAPVLLPRCRPIR